MNHHMIDLTGQEERQFTQLFQKENNLEQRDNLDSLPTTAAVYAICGRVNEQAANPRFVGETENLQESIKAHFAGLPDTDCLNAFMQSIKLKTLIFQLLPDTDPTERADLLAAWKQEFQPQCNETLNAVF